jgi:hypothetical protein
MVQIDHTISRKRARARRDRSRIKRSRSFGTSVALYQSTSRIIIPKGLYANQEINLDLLFIKVKKNLVLIREVGGGERRKKERCRNRGGRIKGL